MRFRARGARRALVASALLALTALTVVAGGSAARTPEASGTEGIIDAQWTPGSLRDAKTTVVVELAGKPVTVGTSQYVPYERTYAGLPEVGGDFVLATDASGQLLYDSVALKRPVGALAITPTLRQADAEAVAAKQLRSVSQVEGSRLVVDKV